MSEGYNAQAEERSVDWWPDQHGRQWSMPVDGRGNPCSTITPMGWSAPLSPPWLRGLLVPPANIVYPRKRPGQSKFLEIDYKAFKAMTRTATQHLKQREMQLAKRFGTNHLDIIRNPTPEFLLERGASPFPSMQVIQMMADGDEWALGLTDVVPEWVKPMLPDMLFSVRAGQMLSPAHQEALEEAELRDHLAQFDGYTVPAHPSVEDVQKVAGVRTPAKPTSRPPKAKEAVPVG